MELNVINKLLKPWLIKEDYLLRLGSFGDGGYVLSNCAVINAEVLVTIGIKDDWNFENDFLKINSSAKIFAFDLVTDFHFFLKCAIYSFLKFRFKKSLFYFKRIFAYFSFFHFDSRVKYLKKGVSGNKDGFLSLSDIINKNEINSNRILLKIDIEGDEYSLLSDFIKHQDKFHMICIEFHNVISENFIFTNFIETISNYYSVVHIHMNNNSKFDSILNLSDVIEVTFANNNYFELEQINQLFKGPTNLDYPCNPLLDEINFSI